MSAATSASTLTGSVSVVQPKRRASQPKCVSTVMPGMPKALPSTTLAVLRPTPGRVTRSFSRGGTSPPNRSHSAWPSPIRRVRLGAVEPGGLDDLFHLVAVGARVVRRGRVPREQGRRDQVDQLVGGLRGQDRRHEQLKRRAEVQLGVHVGVHPRPVRARSGEPGGPGRCAKGAER